MSRPAAPRPARPADHYLHGLNGPNVLVPGRVWHFLERYCGAAEFQRRVRGRDAEVDNVLEALHAATVYWSASVNGTTVRQQAEIAPKSQQLSTTQAADLLGITDRAVRTACQSKRLVAERVNGRWQIDREALAHFRANRAA